MYVLCIVKSWDVLQIPSTFLKLFKLQLHLPHFQITSLDSHDHSSSKNSNKLQQHFMMNDVFFPPSRYSIAQYFCSSMPPSLLNKELPGCAFQRLQHHKRKRQSRMKASLLIQTSSIILSLSEHFSDDDICSNHWVMSHLMLSQTSKVPRRDVEILKEAGEGEGKLTSWIGYVGEGKKTFDTSHSALPFLKSSGIQGGLRNCSVPLIRVHPLGIKQEQKWILFIYLCACECHKGDQTEEKAL